MELLRFSTPVTAVPTRGQKQRGTERDEGGGDRETILLSSCINGFEHIAKGGCIGPQKVHTHNYLYTRVSGTTLFQNINNVWTKF